MVWGFLENLVGRFDGLWRSHRIRSARCAGREGREKGGKRADLFVVLGFVMSLEEDQGKETNIQKII